MFLHIEDRYVVFCKALHIKQETWMLLKPFEVCHVTCIEIEFNSVITISVSATPRI